MGHEEIIETVKVARDDAPGGFVIINKSDLTEDDVLYGEKPKKGGLNAKDTVAAINACETVDELQEVLEEDESRAGVIKAFDKKMAELAEGE